jgi:YD repeat-containing protein
LDQADVLMEDAYEYDALNRLSSVTEQRMSVSGGWGVWQQQFKQAYSYDRYGNRTINAGQTWGTGINNKQFDVQTATNRLLVPSGQSGSMTYDAAGNLTVDTYSSYGTRVYDAENKMTAAQDSYAGWSYYTYDADGRRTRRKINNQETWQVYGFGGELLAEYAANAAAASPQKEYGYRNGQLLVTAEAGTAPPNGYAYQRSITIDHTIVPNTNQSNFPVLIRGTYSYLATVANGGKGVFVKCCVWKISGGDLVSLLL